LDGVKLAREVISLSLAMEEHGGRMFSNGARPGGILSTPAKLSPDQRNDLKAVWAEMQEGSENAFKSAILHGGLTWTPLAQTGVDSQHLEQRRFQVEETCRAFGVYPVKVGHSDKAATYASVQDTSIQHVVDTLGPWYKNIEDSAAVSLLSDKERAEGYYFKHTVQGLMRGASKDRAEYYSKALGSGGSPAWMTQDEIRALEELNPMGGSAAVLPIPTNVNKGVSDGNKAP
jgi:HK97 family phage portal protein